MEGRVGKKEGPGDLLAAGARESESLLRENAGELEKPFSSRNGRGKSEAHSCHQDGDLRESLGRR
jgi:hypothetical protein